MGDFFTTFQSSAIHTRFSSRDGQSNTCVYAQCLNLWTPRPPHPRKGNIMLKSFLPVLSGMVLCISSIQAQPARPKLSPETNAYAAWLITGKGEKPVNLPEGVLLNARDLPDEIEPPHELEFEEEYFRAFHPLGVKTTPEERINALLEAGERSEDRIIKSRSPSLSSPPSEWTQKGPFGMEHHCAPGLFWSGRVTCMDFDPSSGLYLGTEGGGLWGPPLLYPLSDQLATLGIGAVAVDPADPNHIFLGTGPYAPNALSPIGVGLFVTKDHGKNWTLQSTPVTHSGTSKILIAPWDPNIVFVAGNGGILKSTNNGASWTLPMPFNTSDLAAAADGSVMLAGCQRRGVYRSFDQGETWVRLRGDIDWPSSIFGMIKIAIAPSNPRRAYVQITMADSGRLLRVYRTDSDTSTPEPGWADISPGPSLRGYLGNTVTCTMRSPFIRRTRTSSGSAVSR